MNIFDKKYLIKALCLLVCILSSNGASAKDPAKVVVHLNNPLKVTMLVNNVKNLRSNLGKEASIIVVVNGPAVARFTTLSQSREQLDKLLEENSEVSICSFALKNKNLVRDNLYTGTTYLEDGGVSKLVELQQKGYAYIKP